jgi:hypothetical protein
MKAFSYYENVFVFQQYLFFKLYANWVHVSLGIVNNFNFFSLNVLVYYFKNLLLEKAEVEEPSSIVWSTVWEHQQIEKENTSCEFAKCPITGKDMQNFIIESTNRERDKKLKYKKKGWIYEPTINILDSSEKLQP